VDTPRSGGSSRVERVRARAIGIGKGRRQQWADPVATRRDAAEQMATWANIQPGKSGRLRPSAMQ